LSALNPGIETNKKLQPTMRHSAVSRYHWFLGRMSAEFNVGTCMFRKIFACLFVWLSFSSEASTPLDASLSDLACGADHVLVGRVIGVDMIDGKGRQISDPKATTGPGLKNQIRLAVAVDEVLQTTAKKVPKALKVALGDVKNAHAEPSSPVLVFLRGKTFEPVIAGRFLWPIEARAEAIELRLKCTKSIP
jgi:hypothetical protein